MIKNFDHIATEELAKLKAAVAEITVLIAGADGEIDKAEKAWAEKVTQIRSYKMHKDLIEFYQEVGRTFHDDLDNLIDSLPGSVSERQAILETHLSRLNSILPKLSPKVGKMLYNSYLSFAKHVATASGGILGFFSVGPKESQLLNLPMITPIVFEEEEEE